MNSIDAVDRLIDDLIQRRAAFDGAIAGLQGIRRLLQGGAPLIEPALSPAPAAVIEDRRPQARGRRKAGRKPGAGKKRQVRQLPKARAKGRGRMPREHETGDIGGPRRAGGAQDRVWREMAMTASALGHAPSAVALMARTGLDATQFRGAIFNLAKKGLIRVEGRAPNAVYHVERWPEGIRPHKPKGGAAVPIRTESAPGVDRPRAAGPNDHLFGKPKAKSAAAVGEPVPAAVTRSSFGV